VPEAKMVEEVRAVLARHARRRLTFRRSPRQCRHAADLFHRASGGENPR
jgi:hypothetical protein